LLTELAALRGEQNPTGLSEPQHAGIFSRIFGGK
jgi:hypothetical protein